MGHGQFLIDTNSLVTPHLQFYPFDFAPSFWSKMEGHIKSGSVVLLDMVKEEILRGNKTDKLRNWIDNLDAKIIDHRSPNILEKYGKILDYIQKSPYYTSAALNEWSKDTAADPWLIATAAACGYTVITFETHNRNLNARTPSKRIKIPDVADEFGVETKSLYDLMRSLEIKL